MNPFTATSIVLDTTTDILVDTAKTAKRAVAITDSSLEYVQLSIEVPLLEKKAEVAKAKAVLALVELEGHLQSQQDFINPDS